MYLRARRETEDVAESDGDTKHVHTNKNVKQEFITIFTSFGHLEEEKKLSAFTLFILILNVVFQCVAWNTAVPFPRAYTGGNGKTRQHILFSTTQYKTVPRLIEKGIKEIFAELTDGDFVSTFQNSPIHKFLLYVIR